MTSPADDNAHQVAVRDHRAVVRDTIGVALVDNHAFEKARRGAADDFGSQ